MNAERKYSGHKPNYPKNLKEGLIVGHPEAKPFAISTYLPEIQEYNGLLFEYKKTEVAAFFMKRLRAYTLGLRVGEEKCVTTQPKKYLEDSCLKALYQLKEQECIDSLAKNYKNYAKTDVAALVSYSFTKVILSRKKKIKEYRDEIKDAEKTTPPLVLLSLVDSLVDACKLREKFLEPPKGDEARRIEELRTMGAEMVDGTARNKKYTIIRELYDAFKPKFIGILRKYGIAKEEWNSIVYYAIIMSASHLHNNKNVPFFSKISTHLCATVTNMARKSWANNTPVVELDDGHIGKVSMDAEETERDNFAEFLKETMREETLLLLNEDQASLLDRRFLKEMKRQDIAMEELTKEGVEYDETKEYKRKLDAMGNRLGQRLDRAKKQWEKKYREKFGDNENVEATVEILMDRFRTQEQFLEEKQILETIISWIRNEK